MSKKRKGFTLIALMLAAVLLFTENHIDSRATSYASVTSQSIRDKEAQIKAAKEEKKQLQQSLTDAKALKASLESQKNDMKAYVAELDAQVEIIEAKIEDLNNQITVKEAEIAVTEEELARALATEQHQQDSMIALVRTMYKDGETTMWDLFFRGESIGEIFSHIKYLERISEYEKDLLADYKLTRELVELCEQELLLEKEILDETKAGAESEQQALEELIAAKEQAIREYESDIATKEQAIREYEESIEEEDELVKALEEAVAAEKRAIIAASGVVLTYDGGQFKFPLASYTRISDDYGWRMHPTLGVQKFHNGVDFAAPKGTAIYAAYDGVVVAAAYSSSMGNYVMIDHGDGLYTIYMHASKLCCKKDDIVIRGDKIAEVGTTGRSTGNHLHFGVRLNGEYVTPWNYLKN